MASSPEMLRIEPAAERHVGVILQLIKGLADYEKLSHEVSASEDRLRESLFGDASGAEVLLAFVADDAVGFAVFFHNFSTFLGRSGIYMEDLFVLPQWRKQGIGRRLLEAVAQIAVERDCGRLEWSVLDWNEPAIRFYESFGAQAMDEWTVFRLSGSALRNFGAKRN